MELDLGRSQETRRSASDWDLEDWTDSEASADRGNIGQRDSGKLEAGSGKLEAGQTVQGGQRACDPQRGVRSGIRIRRRIAPASIQGVDPPGRSTRAAAGAALRCAPGTLAEFEPLAKRRMTHMAYEYVSAGAGDEITLRENQSAFDRLRLHPRVLSGRLGASTRG